MIFLWLIDYFRIVISQVLDKVFFKPDYNIHDFLVVIFRKLQEVNDVSALLAIIKNDLAFTLKVEKITMYIKQPEGDDFINLEVGDDYLGENRVGRIDSNDALIDVLKNSNNNSIIWEKIEKSSESQCKLVADFMHKMAASSVIASVDDNKVRGFFVVGQKKNKRNLNNKDYQLLSYLVHQSTIVVSKIFEIEKNVKIRAEKELHRQHSEELEGKNSELKRVLDELKVAQEKLIEEEQLSAMGKLAGEVAHDIRNPLSSMNRLILHILDEDYIEKNEQVLVNLYEKLEGGSDVELKQLEMVRFLLSNNIEFKESLENIQEINTNLRTIANDFLEYSKVSKDIPTESVVIKDVIQEKLDYYTDECSVRKIKFKELVTSIKPIYMFPHQLNRVFSNLVDNAVKAVVENEKEKSGEVVVLIRDLDDSVLIEISDNGIGMDPDQLKQIFKPFYTKRKNLQGTGLGLPIVKKIIDSVNGSIKVESVVNEGTVFKIEIPTQST